jgi:radical SAM superfamily enzyme YgiQ (UPF0313 family)
MKVTFLCSGYESLGVEYLSACLKRRGHQTNLVFDPALFGAVPFLNHTLHKLFSYDKIVVDKVIESKPDLIGFSVVSDTYNWACKIAKEIKRKRDIPIIFGGMHPTSLPDLVIKNDFVDYICIGEGEESIVEFVDALSQGKNTTFIRNIWSKKNNEIIKNQLRPLISDLDSLPFPDKDIFHRIHKEATQHYHIYAGKGCLYDCTFCHHNVLKRLYGKDRSYMRQRSVANVIEELMWAKKRYSINKVCFIDDLFAYDKEWLSEFSPKYRKLIDLPFSCAVHPAHIDKEAVQLLSEAGCAAVGIGMQTDSFQLRKEILHRYESNEQIKKAFEILKKSRIFFYVDIIVGIPKQNEEELINTTKFLNKYRPDSVFAFWLKYYPGTEIVEIAGRENELTQEERSQIENASCHNEFCKDQVLAFKRIGKGWPDFISFSPNLPSFFVDFIIKNRLYRFMLPRWVCFSFWMLVSTYKSLFERKRKYHYLSLWEKAKYYNRYTLKKILYVVNAAI